MFPIEQEGEEGTIKSLHLSARNNFITKVFGILVYQLTLTFGFVFCAFHFPVFKTWIQQHWWMSIVAIVVAIICQYALFCYRNVARTVPLNYIVLTVFTLGYGYFVCAVTIQYPLKTVLYAAGLTLLMTILVTIYSQFMGPEIIVVLGILIIAAILLVVGTIVSWFVHIGWLETAIGILGVIVFSIYLLFDISIIIGNGERAIAIDEYIFAAIILYVDIIQIFLYMLQALGGSD